MLTWMNGGLGRRPSCGLLQLLSGDSFLNMILKSYSDTATYCMSRIVSSLPPGLVVVCPRRCLEAVRYLYLATTTYLDLG